MAETCVVCGVRISRLTDRGTHRAVGEAASPHEQQPGQRAAFRGEKGVRSGDVCAAQVRLTEYRNR
jgi:hypothetical protein